MTEPAGLVFAFAENEVFAARAGVADDKAAEFLSKEILDACGAGQEQAEAEFFVVLGNGVFDAGDVGLEL